MNRHKVFPLTVEEVLDDSAFDPPDQYPNIRGYDEKWYPVLLAPPSTPTNGLDYQDGESLDREYSSPDDLRWGSFSSEGSSPSMVDDSSGSSDSDAEPPIDDFSPKTTDFLLYQYEKLWGVSHENAPTVRRYDPQVESSPSSRKYPGVPREHSQPPPRPRLANFPGAGKLTPISPTLDDRHASLHRSHAQRTGRRTANTLKTPPQKRGGSHLPRHSSKNAQGWSPLPPHREHPFYVDSPYRLRPSASPCDNSQPFSFHNTPPLPYLSPTEKSVFECDSDEEGESESDSRSSSLVSKLHFRSVSVGNKRLGFTGSNDGGKQSHKANGRRRSATDVFRGIFGMRKN